MRDVAIAVAAAGTSAKTRANHPLAFTAVQMSLLAQDPEGYAKGCTALASAVNLKINFEQIGNKVRTLIITGDEDKISPPAHVQKLATVMGGDSIVLPGVGHWHVFEDCEGISGAVTGFLLAQSAKTEVKEGRLTNGR
jgi:pimeloyl-ACP methyl ester carboxylesterase